MAKAKKTDTKKSDKSAEAAVENDQPSIINHSGPVLTAPVLPIEELNNDKSVKKASRAKTAKPAEDDDTHIITVKRLNTVKPLSETVQDTETVSEPETIPQPVTTSEPEIVSRPEPKVEKKPAPTDEAEPEVAKPAPEPETEPQAEPAEEPAEPAKHPKVDDEAEAKRQAEQDAAVQKLVDSKQYFLPINTVEKRRSKRFVAVGILLSLLLLLAWADIALDAGLINLPNVQPVTHFFSN